MVLFYNTAALTASNHHIIPMFAVCEQPADDKPDVVVLDREAPSSPTDWALFTCPELARHIFRTNTHPHCINKGSIDKQVGPRAFVCL